MEAYWRAQPITPASNHTGSLVGDLFTQALNLPIGQNGKDTLIFVFAVGLLWLSLFACSHNLFQDLSVQLEGWFLFRYRVFDLFSVRDSNSQPILAECWGRPFRIYATKQFPGLEPSTELTKVIHDHSPRIMVSNQRHRSLLSSSCTVIMCPSEPGKFAGSARRIQTPSPAEILTKSNPLPREAKTENYNAASYETISRPHLPSAFVCVMLLLPLVVLYFVLTRRISFICNAKFAYGFFFHWRTRSVFSGPDRRSTHV